MIKYVALLKRRAGLSFEQFKADYESRHAILGKEHMPGACGYKRTFLSAKGHPFTGGAEETYDCITEVLFENEEEMARAFNHISQPEIAKIIADDEDRIFDRSKIRCFIVDEECISDYSRG